MLFRNVCLESIGYCLPEESVSSSEIELQLEPTYTRLRLPTGRLELITGVAERRFWSAGTLPSEKSLVSASQALQAVDFPAKRVGALIHASVCRDHLEPATACAVHHGLGLPPDCVIFDLSNACLGLLNGMLQVASMIELGQIQSGLVVGTEGSRQLVETTIATLNASTNLTRKTIKSAIASLTIGSASCAVLLVHRDLSRTKNDLLGAAVRSHSQFHTLCQSGADEAVATGMQPVMVTDSETLLHEGIATGVATFQQFLSLLNWSRQSIHKTICHQVGPTHQKAMLESLKLRQEDDFTTVRWLGNTGSVALPITMAIAAQQSHLSKGNRVALLGIGSGINCVMIGIDLRSELAVSSPGGSRCSPPATLFAGP